MILSTLFIAIYLSVYMKMPKDDGGDSDEN